MKQGWEIKSLGEIADVEYGFTDKSTEEGNYRYVRITDIDNNGELISSEKKYLKHSKEAETFLIHDNDILMARTGATFAKVLLYEDLEPSVFASYLIRIKFREKIENKLYWYFSKTKSYWDQANSLASGAAQPHFNGAALKQVIFSYPKSISEQQRIVSILDEAFSAIAKAKANAEQNLRNAKELFESYLQGVFEIKGDGWEEKMLKEIGITQTGTTPKTADKENYGEYIPFIKPADIDIKGNGEIRYDKDGLSEQGLKIGRKMLNGSILMVCIGATIGKVGFVDRDVSCNQQINSLTVKKDFSQKFIYYALSTKGFYDQIMLNSAQATLPIINKGKWETLTVSFPKSKIEQEKIANTFDLLQAETKKLEAIYQQKINDLEELKKSILQKAFSGELSTRGQD
ncbi:MAG: restriction endonuclease subunit S [Saprospiraceae bacterium]